jgi:hypothetical protein
MLHRQLLGEVGMASRARLLSCKGKNAGAWLLAIPMDQSSVLPNAAYRTAFRLRLGLPPVDVMPVRCHCGYDLSRDHYHHLSCNREKATTVNHRHDLIVDAIFFWSRRAGSVALKEPEDLDHRDERRADLLITMSCGEILTDVVVRHPNAPSLVSRAAQAPLAAALDAEQYKRARYGDMAESMGAAFSAFAVETYGAFGPQAAELVERIAAYARISDCWPSKSVLTGLTNAVAMAIQKGNARVLATGIKRSRAALRTGYGRSARIARASG